MNSSSSARRSLGASRQSNRAHKGSNGEISGSSGSLVHLAGFVVARGVSGAGPGAAGVARRASVSHRWPMLRRGLRFAQNPSVPARASSGLSGLTITFRTPLQWRDVRGDLPEGEFAWLK